MPDRFLLAYSHWLINIGFAASVLFAPLNSLWWPWWREAWGWNIVSLEVCIAGDLISSVLFVDFHLTSDMLQWATIVFLTLTIAIIIWRSIMIWRIQRAAAPESSTRQRAGDEEGSACR